MKRCLVCGNKPSRIPFVVTVLSVLVVASWAGIGIAIWDIRNLRDEASRRPQAAFITVTGNYPHLKVYPEGWDMAEPEKMLETQPQPKPNGKKK